MIDPKTNKLKNPDNSTLPIVGLACDERKYLYDDWHSHERGQLLYAVSGSMQLVTHEQMTIIPPTQAAWIPSEVAHRGHSLGGIKYRSLYLDKDSAAALPKRLTIFGISPLLTALIERICFFAEQDLLRKHEQSMVQVFLGELQLAPQLPYTVPMPNSRLLNKALSLLMDTSVQYTAQEIANHCFVSPKTLSRRFKEATGMTLTQWRQQYNCYPGY